MPTQVLVRKGSRLNLGHGGQIQLETPRGKGGQGTVWASRLEGPIAVKVYSPEELQKRGRELEDKLSTMVDRPPINPTQRLGHESFAWPLDIVTDNRRQFVGFTMPLLKQGDWAPLHQVANPSDRGNKRSASLGLPAWLRAFDDWRRLVGTAANLASATASIHQGNYVIGDFNESNILVTPRSLVTLIDCDSMQVKDPTGREFLCPVGKAEYRAPEVSRVRAEKLTTHSDTFALAIHIFVLLMQGRHPFSGVWHGSGDKPRVEVLAQRGLYSLSGDPTLTPAPGAPPSDILPDQIRAMFRSAFVAGARTPSSRPSAAEWKAALTELAADLTTCRSPQKHTYPRSFGKTCPWCSMAKNRVARSSATSSGSPTILNAVSQPRSIPYPAPSNNAPPPAQYATTSFTPPPQPPRLRNPYTSGSSNRLGTIASGYNTRRTRATSNYYRARSTANRAWVWAKRGIVALVVLVIAQSCMSFVSFKDRSPANGLSAPASDRNTATTQPKAGGSNLSTAPSDRPEAVLSRLRDENFSQIEGTLANRWVPQLASGIDDPKDILEKHLKLQSAFGALLYNSDDYVSSYAHYWVTIAPVGFGDAEQALSWCAAQRLDNEHCFAKLLTHDPSIDPIVEYQH